MMKNTNKKVLAMAAAAALVFGFNSMAADNNVQYDNDDHTTITLNGTKITGAGKGSITSTSTDLVTGGQLYSRFSDIDDSINNINLNIASNNETVSAIQNKLTETTTKANTALNSIKTTGFWYDVNGKRAFNMTSSNNEMNLVAGDNMNISSVTNTSGTATGIKFGVKSTGKVEAGNTGIVTGDTVYRAIKDMPTDASFAGKASTALDNLTEAGEAKITTAATDAARKAAASKAETDGSNIDVAKYSAKLGTTAVTENGTGLMTSGGVYTALSGLGDTYAKTDASNISISSWQKALGTGKNEANDNGLITGDTLNKALSGFTGGKTYTAGTGINISDDNKISVKAEGSIASGNTGLVTGGQVADAISKATEGLATDTNIANKADKDLSNITDAGKQVIQDTMKDSLAQKADASKLTEVSGKVDSNTSAIASLKENKADKTYVDTSLAKKADKADVDTLSGKVSDNEKSITNLKDSKAEKDGSNIDVNSFSTKLNTGKVERGNNGLVSGGQVADAISKATEGLATDTNIANKADKDLSNITDAGKQVIQDTMKNSLAQKADASKLTEVSGKVDSNTSDISSLKENKADKTYVDEGLAKKADISYVDQGLEKKADIDSVYTKQETDKKIAESTAAINASVSNKADKDLSNITDAGKQVIQDTMKDSLAKKADASKLTEVSGKVDSNTSAIASLKENKADKTYVDTSLAKKADKADVDTLSGKVSDNEKSITNLKDSKAEKDGSNIDVNSFSTKLNTGKVERGNNGLVSGGTVFSAVESIKKSTGIGLVTVEDNTVKIAKDSEASRIDVSGANGSRVITGVATNARDMSSSANVGYVNGVADGIYHDMDAMNHNLTKDIKDAGAVGAALAGLHHLDYDPDNKLDVAVAAGTYRGTTAKALGLFYQPNENVMFSVGGTMGADHNAFNAGVSFKIGRGANGQTTSKAAMAAEIRTLKADNEKQAQEIKELKDQVALLMQKMELSSTVEKSIVK